MTESRPAGGTGSLDPKDYGVLYVDDERSNLAVLESSFSEAFRIWTANSVGDALEILDREPIAIAMVDQRMPEMEGTAFCELLRERFPDVKRILITAYASQRTAVEAINRGGVHHFMAKPWKWPELFQLLHGMIEKVHLERTVGRLQRAVLAQERTQTLSLMRAGILHDLAGMTAGMSVVCSALRHHVDDIATRMLPEDLRLLNDELDIVFDLKPSDFAVLDGQDGINAARVPGIGVQFIQFNTQNPAMPDPRVRRAIGYGFDRATLLETVFEGAGSLLWGPPAFDQSDPELDRYEFDPEKAEALLAEAEADGWDRSQPLRLVYIQEEPGWPEIAAAFANDMSNLGLNVVLEPSDGAGWQAKLPFPGDYEISLQCCGSFFHPDRNSGMFSTDAPVGTFYGNAEVEQGFRDARETGSADEQAAIYQGIARILNAEAPYVYMWFVANTHANSTDVGDFTYYPNARESFAQIEKWTLQ